MHITRTTAMPQCLIPVLVLTPVLCCSCREGTPSLHAPPPAVNAARVARQAIERHDHNRDERLTEDELDSCRSLQRELTRYDTDGSGALSEQEIVDKLESILERSSGLISFTCTISWNGRALPNATVMLEPEELLASVIKPATGITDAKGSAELAMDAKDTPASYDALPVVQPGLYKVRVTHPVVKLPERYNLQTILGCEVSAETANPAFPVRFELRSR